MSQPSQAERLATLEAAAKKHDDEDGRLNAEVHELRHDLQQNTVALLALKDLPAEVAKLNKNFSDINRMRWIGVGILSTLAACWTVVSMALGSVWPALARKLGWAG